MGPKSKFSKEQIIDAAFEIARSNGMDSITIRGVAEKLGSSVAPIYVNFKDIDELLQAVVRKVFDIGQQILAEQLEKNSGSPFLDIAMASLRFAKEYSALFRDLMMKKNNYMDNYDQDMAPMIIQEMKKDEDLKDFTEEELMTILFKMRVCQLGLSVMVANDLLPKDFNEEKMLDILNSTASDVIIATRMGNKK